MACTDNAAMPFEYCSDAAALLGRYVPFEALVTEHDVKTRGGDLIRTWRLEALCGEDDGVKEALERHAGFCCLLQKLAGGRFAVWAHRTRRRCPVAGSDGPDATLEAVHPQAAARSMLEEVYLTVLVRSVPRRSPRFLRIPRKSIRTPPRCHRELLSSMSDTSLLVADLLSELRPHLLGDYFVAGRHYSEMLEFLDFLVNGCWSRQEVIPAPLYISLARACVAFAGEKILFRRGGQMRHAVAFGMADCFQSHPARTRNLRLPRDWEFIETQSFSLASERPQDSGVAAHRQQHAALLEDAPSGTPSHYASGDYHYSLVLFGKNAREMEHRAATAAYVIGATMGPAVALCDMSDAAWFSQWPSTWSWRARQARSSTRAVAALSRFQALPDGHRAAADDTL